VSTRRLSVVLELDTGRYSGKLGDAGAKMKVFSGTVNSTSTSVKKLQGSFDNLGNHMATPLSKLRDYVLILGNIRLAILNVRDIAVGWVGSLLKQSAEVQRLTILMKGLSSATTEFGKEREAERNLSRLFEMARKNGFAIKDLADAYVKLKTGGLDPMNGSLQSLTDAVAKFGGNSDVMHRASIAIQQMAGKGVVSMEELRQQLGEAVPTAMWDMARAAGMSMQEFTKLVSKGKVQAKPALALMFQEFERMYSGSGAAIGQTLLGQVDQFKTNLTQLATAFTGMAAGQTDNLRGYMEEQKLLFEQGKITRDAFEASQQNGGAGMFAGATDAMRQINEAMRSSEARVFMKDLGDGINKVMQGLMSAGAFVVRWRTQIGGAIMGIVAAFAMVKTVQLGAWLYQIGVNGVTAMTNIFNGTTPLLPVFKQLDSGLRSYADTQTRVANIAALRVQRAREEITTSNQLTASLQTQISGLRQQAAQYTQSLQLLAQQRASQLLQLRTAQTLHAANIAQGRSGVQSAMAVKAAQDALNATTRTTINVRRQLALTDGQLALAEREVTVATTTATAAQARLSASQGLGAVAARVLATASTIAAGAVTFLGRAMQIALGPIGMIAMALYAAASAAGVFEHSADRATEAVGRLMQGMASLDDMKEAQKQKESIQKRLTERANKYNKGGHYQYTSIDGHRTRTWVGYDAETKARMRKEQEADKARYRHTEQAMRRGAYGLSSERVSNNFGAWDEQREEQSNRLKADYRSRVASGQINEKNSAVEAQKLNDRLLAPYENGVNEMQRRRDAMLKANPKADTREVDMMLGKLVEARDAFKSMHQPVTQLQGDLLGVGKAGAGAGTNTHKALTDAEKDAKKAATAFENARDKYDKLIDGQEGEIAALNEQLAGGDKTGTARFEALKQAGFYADATNDELVKMAENFKKIDELNSEIKFEKSLGSLRKQVAKTAEEATQLWTALNNNTWDTSQRDAQYRSRFADLLEGVDDPAKLATINAEIDKVVANIKKADAAEIAQGWITSAQEIENGLLSENEARQRNFDLEVERQRRLLELTVAGSQERINAEAAFERWKKAQEQRLARDSESGIIKQARDWAKLGSNIDQVFTQAAASMVDMLATGEGNIMDFAGSVMKQLFKVILQAMIAYAILSAIGQTNGVSFGDFMKGGLKNFAGGFTPGGGSPAGANNQGLPPPNFAYSTPPYVGTNHKGGLMGQGSAVAMVGAHLWNNAQTRHGGGWIGGRGLKKGEVPIVGMEKELVLTEEQQRLLGNQLSGKGGGLPPSVSVNVINNSGTKLEAEQGEPDFNGKEYVVNVIVEAAQKQGPLRDVLSQVGKS
jgi:tape measure domain-containing protein